jgi:hypothetical protein
VTAGLSRPGRVPGPSSAPSSRPGRLPARTAPGPDGCRDSDLITPWHRDTDRLAFRVPSPELQLAKLLDTRSGSCMAACAGRTCAPLVPGPGPVDPGFQVLPGRRRPIFQSKFSCPLCALLVMNKSPLFKGMTRSAINSAKYLIGKKQTVAIVYPSSTRTKLKTEVLGTPSRNQAAQRVASDETDLFAGKLMMPSQSLRPA